MLVYVVRCLLCWSWLDASNWRLTSLSYLPFYRSSLRQPNFQHRGWVGVLQNKIKHCVLSGAIISMLQRNRIVESVLMHTSKNHHSPAVYRQNTKTHYVEHTLYNLLNKKSVFLQSREKIMWPLLLSDSWFTKSYDSLFFTKEKKEENKTYNFSTTNK